MSDHDENLYETRTNLFSSENIVDYLWRRCEKNYYPFKPDNSFGINTEEIDKNYVKGKELLSHYIVNTKDMKEADIRTGQEYNIDIVAFETVNMDKVQISKGKVALVYRSDRRYYSLFDIHDNSFGEEEMTLLMKVKQKVGLFGSFETEMFYYY